MIKKMPAVLLALVVLGAGAAAQEKPEKPRKVPTPLKLQVVFSRYQGDKKVGSSPYTLWVNADDRPTRVRMGIQVPLMYAGKDIPGNVVYKDVGNNMDCGAEALEDGRFKLACSFEQSAVYSADGEVKGPASARGEGSLSPPLLRKFSYEGNLLLRDGQSTQLTTATDPVSGDVLKVDLTLSVVK